MMPGRPLLTTTIRCFGVWAWTGTWRSAPAQRRGRENKNRLNMSFPILRQAGSGRAVRGAALRRIMEENATQVQRLGCRSVIPYLVGDRVHGVSAGAGRAAADPDGDQHR